MNDIQIILATSLSLLITFTFHRALLDKRASNSVFEYIVEDTFHHGYLFLSCSMNGRGIRIYTKNCFMLFL
jgi:hypothetical protein